MNVRVGQILVERGAITQQQLDNALQTQRTQGGRLGEILLHQGAITESELTRVLSEQLSIPLLSLKQLIVLPEASLLADVEVLEKCRMLPLRRVDDTLIVAAVDPLDIQSIDELYLTTGLSIKLAVCTRADMNKAMAHYFHGVPCEEIAQAEVTRNRNLHQPQRSTPPLPVRAVLETLVDMLAEKGVVDKQELLRTAAARAPNDKPSSSSLRPAIRK
jgi:hypothetical protein